MNNRIKEFRAKFDLTQEELARKVNVRRETIVFLEKTNTTPPSNWHTILQKYSLRQ
jgi:putative transcriptional regulator